MELGEPASVGAPSQSSHDKKNCPFCCDSDDQARKQDLDNNPGTLRNSCHDGDVTGLAEPIGANIWLVIYTHPQSAQESISEVRSNPHHLIPGEASLAGHAILEAIAKDKGTITADIGYNVNGQSNGIWLPTILEDFYAGKPTPPSAGISWGRLTKEYPTHQFTMAEAAMFEASRQFHDAHPDYSEEVKLRLDKFLDNLKRSKVICPDTGPKPKPFVPPPYGLVARLDTLSLSLAGKLMGSPLRWKRPYYTSRHAIDFADKLQQAGSP
jgi:hypothetical protein